MSVSGQCAVHASNAADPLVALRGCKFIQTEWADGDRFEIQAADRVHHTIRLYDADCIDWQRDWIQWLINDRVVRERVPEHWGAPTDSHAPFDHHFHLVMNLAVGGPFPGSPADSTRFPAAMEVDWVRVWQ